MLGLFVLSYSKKVFNPKSGKPKLPLPKFQPKKIFPPKKLEKNEFVPFPKKFVGTVKQDNVLLFEGPSVDSKVKAAFTRDHNINIVGAEGPFYKIEYPGYEGYMEAKDVTVDQTNEPDWISKIIDRPIMIYKPVIYLYPERSQMVNVKLTYPGAMTATYPKPTAVAGEKNTYEWNVFAHRNGILSIKDKRYGYLFWEAQKAFQEEMSEGFVVEGKNAEKFLEEKLTILGLNAHERNDFIVYWLPQLERNAYNLVSFQGKAYTDAAQLKIKPEPEHIIRVFMAFKKLDGPIRVVEQKLEKVNRHALHGFVAVEWGGFEAK